MHLCNTQKIVTMLRKRWIDLHASEFTFRLCTRENAMTEIAQNPPPTEDVFNPHSREYLDNPNAVVFKRLCLKTRRR